MCLQHTFGCLGDIHISQLNLSVFEEKHISTLDISMQYFQLVEGLESSGNLDDDAPYFLLCELRSVFVME